MVKKLIYTFVIFVACANFSFAQSENAYLQYNSSEYNYSNLNIKKVLKAADSNMLLFQKSQTFENQKKYINEAMRNYYLATKIDNASVDAFVGLARVYDAMNLDKLAKEHFFKALNLNTYNPRVNFYFGNFYFRRSEYLQALSYYKVAYQYGYAKNYELNLRLGVLYEKLADINAAKAFYSNALRLNPKNQELFEKIRLLDELNYGNSQYYLFEKENNY